MDSLVKALAESGNTEYAKEVTFCLEKARMALDAWRDLDISKEGLSKYINMQYKDFCSLSDSVRGSLFRLVAYSDDHAREKNILNEYSDKRTIARCGIRQNCWVTQLLKYKKDKESVSDSIKNVIAYIDDPKNNFPIVSEAHRQMICDYFLKRPYDKDSFQKQLLDYMDSYGTLIDCEDNKTFVYTMALYKIASLWIPKNQVKGLVVGDVTDRKEKFRKEVYENDGWGVARWNALPSDFSRYRSRLYELIEQDGDFPLYIVANNHAEYCFNIVDFATEKDYDRKREDWKIHNPVWYTSDFEDYNNGTQQAKIVFLCHGIEKLSKYKQIPIEQFKFFSKSPSVKNPVAFTNITNPMNEAKSKFLDGIVSLLQLKKNIILQGAPGTGKTYTTASIAVRTCNKHFDDYSDHGKVMEEYQQLQNAKRISFCTFHQSMDYEDFVEGLKPEAKDGTIEYKVDAGIFKRICEEAQKKENIDKPYILIIDEINRGNVSRIFGELITLLEADKRCGEEERGISIILPYSKKEFSVPSNLYIIGTMNTTDRSTGSIDYAVRRRFAFVTLESSVDILKDWYAINNIEDDGLRETALELFAQINGKSKDDKNAFIVKHKVADFELEDLKIGHSYFMAKNLDGLKLKMRYEVIPLIKEYIKDGILQSEKDDNKYFEKWMNGECYNETSDIVNNEAE